MPAGQGDAGHLAAVAVEHQHLPAAARPAGRHRDQLGVGAEGEAVDHRSPAGQPPQPLGLQQHPGRLARPPDQHRPAPGGGRGPAEPLEPRPGPAGSGEHPGPGRPGDRAAELDRPGPPADRVQEQAAVGRLPGRVGAGQQLPAGAGQAVGEEVGRTELAAGAVGLDPGDHAAVQGDQDARPVGPDHGPCPDVLGQHPAVGAVGVDLLQPARPRHQQRPAAEAGAVEDLVLDPELGRLGGRREPDLRGRRVRARDHREGEQQAGHGAGREPGQSPRRRAGAGRAVVPDLRVAEQSSHSRPYLNGAIVEDFRGL